MKISKQLMTSCSYMCWLQLSKPARLVLQRNRAASAPVYRHRQSVLGLRPSSHTKARTSPYPRNPDLNRYPVPEEKVTYIIVAARSCWRRFVSPSLSCMRPFHCIHPNKRYTSTTTDMYMYAIGYMLWFVCGGRSRGMSTTPNTTL